MSAYYCHRCQNNRCTSDCVPGEIYGETACELCVDDFETALEEYTAAAEILERECKNCRQSRFGPDTGRPYWCNLTGTSMGFYLKDFGCNQFKGKR